MKSLRISFFYILLILPCCSPLYPVTLVYNMRVRRIFSQGTEILGLKENPIRVASAVPIFYKRDRHIINPRLAQNIVETRDSNGAIFNVRYIGPKKLWWGEITTGLEKERVLSRGTSSFCKSRTGFDDLVFTIGHNRFPTKHTQLVFYTIAGIPTKRSVTRFDAQEPLVGSRFFSTGFGAELSHGFISTLQRSFIGLVQVRFIHIFSREWQPILPPNSKIQPGNVTDLLFALQYREKRHIFETGYNATFFTNQAVILPAETIKTEPFVRNSVYISYSNFQQVLPLIKLPGLLGTGVSIGRLERFNTKIFTWWLNISVLF